MAPLRQNRAVLAFIFLGTIIVFLGVVELKNHGLFEKNLQTSRSLRVKEQFALELRTLNAKLSHYESKLLQLETGKDADAIVAVQLRALKNKLRVALRKQKEFEVRARAAESALASTKATPPPATKRPSSGTRLKAPSTTPSAPAGHTHATHDHHHDSDTVSAARNAMFDAGTDASAQHAEFHKTAAHTHDGPLVTMFTTQMESNTPLKNMIQRNTIRTLSFLRPEVEVVVFTKSEKWAALAREEGIEAVSDFRVNPYGTPILRSMFQHIQRTVKSPFFGYTNGDILFSSDLLATLHVVAQKMEQGILGKKILCVGRRINVNVGESDIIRKESLDKDVRRLAKRGKLFQTNAEDFFIITRGTYDFERMPDFVIGRPAYDNWLVDHAVHTNVDVIDVTHTVHAVHQTGRDGNFAGHSKARPDSQWNMRLARGQWDHGDTDNAQFATLWSKDKHHVVLKPMISSDFSPMEIEMLEDYLTKKPNSVFLHYDNGDNRLVAHLASSVGTYYFIAHQKGCAQDRARAVNTPNVKVHCVSLRGKPSGPSKFSFYRPVLEAAASLPHSKFDVVLIDGRARPQAAAYILPFLSADGVVLIHDWDARKYYHTALDLYTVEKHLETGRSDGGGLVALRPRPGAADTNAEEWMKKRRFW